MLRKISWPLLMGVFLVASVFASERMNLSELEQAVWQRYEASLANASSPFIPMPGKDAKTLQGMYTILEEKFEGDFPGDFWTTWSGFSREFCWGKVAEPVFGGKGAVWCGVTPNLFPYTKDWDETVFHTKKSIQIPEELKVKWIKLEFWLKQIMPPGGAGISPQGNVIVSIVVYKKDGQKELFMKFFNKTTDGYALQEIDLAELTDCSQIDQVWFEIAYRTKETKVPAGIGAWIDNLKMRVHYWDPIDANFEAMPLAGKAPLDVTFFSDCEGAPNHFQWCFGDGNSLEYSEPYNARTPKIHTYTKPGEYDVRLKCWNQVYEDSLLIPNLIYVDSVLEYCPLTLLASGATYPGEDWTNAIDHDILGQGAMASGVKGDAWARFKMADEQERLVAKIRLLNDVSGERQWRTNCAKDVKISLSMTGAFSGEETVLWHTCTGIRGKWDEAATLVGDEPVRAKYIKIEILSSLGANAPYRELVEMQVLGTLPDADDEFTDPLASGQSGMPDDFSVVRNYPNPFNPETTIRFQLKEMSRVNLAIYNLQGQLVRTLVNRELAGGAHNFRWDARDSQGMPVAGGIYLYKLQIGNDAAPVQIMRKMTLLK